MSDFVQPEPCLGRRGLRTDCDLDGRCYSAAACSVFGYCRVRAIKARRLGQSSNGEIPAELQEQWKAEAKRRAQAEQAAYLEKIEADAKGYDPTAIFSSQQLQHEAKK